MKLNKIKLCIFSTFQELKCCNINQKIKLCIFTFLYSIWFLTLINFEAFLTPYVLLAILFIFCTAKNMLNNNYKRIYIYIYSVLFTFIVVLANYKTWLQTPLNFLTLNFDIYSFNIIVFFVILCGSFFGFYNVFLFINYRVTKTEFSFTNNKQIVKPKKYFVLSLFSIVIVYLVILFSISYPGWLNFDSFMQIEQGINGEYTNHHPFFHTILIEYILDFGMMLFDNINTAVCLYSIFQITLMAVCFSSTIYTLCQIKIKKSIISILLIFYISAPYHIMYSHTMWKDAMFGLFVLFYCNFLFRLLFDIGNWQWANCLLTLFFGICVCLFRSNAIFAFIVFAAITIVICRKRCVILTMVVVILLGVFLRFPFMALINVPQPNMGEGMSIPAQQIAKIRIDYNDFNEDDASFLSNIVDLDSIPEKYNKENADGIKDQFRDKNPEFLRNNLLQFVSVYINNGLKHPLSYLTTWIDQTVGYWNSGYYHGYYYNDSRNNNLGIQHTVNCEVLNTVMQYYSLMFYLPGLNLFISRGVWFWLLIVLSFICICKNNYYKLPMIILAVCIVLTVILSTPGPHQFRYVYFLFCCVPYLTIITFWSPNVFKERKWNLKC